MAIISMKKLTLVGYGKDKNKVLRNLQKTGCVEIQNTELLENTFTKEETENKEVISTNLMRLQFVFDFLKGEKRVADKLYKQDEKAEKKAEKKKLPPPEDRLDYKPTKKKRFNPTPRFDFDEFYKITEREADIFEKVSEIEAINQKYVDIKAEISKLQSTYEQLEVFSPIAVKLSAFSDTLHTAIILGAVPRAKAAAVEAIKNDFPMMYAEVGDGTNKLTPVVVIALKTELDKITERLNEIEFIRTAFNVDMTAEERMAAITERVKELKNQKQELLEQSMALADNMSEFKQLFDYYSIENARMKAADGFALTKSSFILEGWFPADEEQKVLDALNEASDALVIETREPIDGDPVPTLTRNNKVVAPYECITNMYSYPSIRDIDPNPFVAFFYFLMFGIMMGDAVYGLILMLGGFAIYYFAKPVPGKGKLVLVIAMGGLSTFIWGIVFGGWMAFDVSGTFLEKLIWFKPIDETNPNTAIYMLLLSLGVGVFQIFFGMGLNAYQLIKKGQIREAFVKTFSWYLLFIGIFFFALPLLTKKPNDGLKITGIVFLAIGLACMIILPMFDKNKKGIKKLFGGFGELYGSLNLLSDILSYSRLFGLGLATGVIGMVINEICKVIISLLTFGGVPIVGVIVAAPIFIGGHLFNVGINTLGTYVHNSRLQFIEFFGKFYEGGGHEFRPLGSNTKYTYIEK